MKSLYQRLLMLLRCEFWDGGPFGCFMEGRGACTLAFAKLVDDKIAIHTLEYYLFSLSHRDVFCVVHTFGSHVTHKTNRKSSGLGTTHWTAEET
jgi:hypothetical protein